MGAKIALAAPIQFKAVVAMAGEIFKWESMMAQAGAEAEDPDCVFLAFAADQPEVTV